MLYSILFELSYLPFLDKLIIFLTFTFSAVFALTFHEFSHAFIAYKLGDSTPKISGRLTLNPMAHFDSLGLICFVLLGFGWAKPVPINTFNFKKTKRDILLVSLAGIVMNFIIAFISYPLLLLIIAYVKNEYLYKILFYLFLFLFQSNLVFMAFNLLPIYPLDGFNAISSQLKYNNSFVKFMYKYSSIILIATILICNYTNLFSLLVSYVGYPIEKFWILIFNLA